MANDLAMMLPNLARFTTHGALWLNVSDDMNHPVNWEAISAIGQIVGAIAVVVSLIYLTREIRRNARAARVASLHDINRWLGEIVAHPDVRELYYRGIHDFESLKGGDIVGFGMLMSQAFFTFQELYYQQLDGHLDARVWGPTEAAVRDLNGYPGVQAWWRSRSQYFNKEFANYVNQLQQTAKAPRLYSEPMGDEG